MLQNSSKNIFLSIISFIFIISCSKNDEKPVEQNEPIVPDLVLTKTDKVVANPPINLSNYYYWITKSAINDTFYIHNADNDPDTSVRGMMFYSLTSNSFVVKTKCSNIKAAGNISQLIAVAAGNSETLCYIGNEYNEYSIGSDTWRQVASAFPNSIKSNHGSSQGCLRFSAAKIFYIGGTLPCKTVKYINGSLGWSIAADYPIETSGGPEVVANNLECMYALGGYDSGGSRIKDFFKYTDATNTWTKLPDAPVTAATDNIKRKMVFYKEKYVIYLGTDNKLHTFNIETNKWQDTTIDVTGTLGQEHLEVVGYGDNSKIVLLYRKANGSLGIQEFK